MDTELESPPIEEQPTGTALAETKPVEQDLAKVDLQAVALAHFAPARAAVKLATEKLAGVVHDLSTPGKLADAKSLRFRLIGTPLAEARKTSVALKSRLTKVSAAVGDELKAIEAAFDKAEALITPQIKAREDQLAEEARIAAEKEAARVAKHRENLAKLAEPAERCRQPDMTAERIANGIALVEKRVIDRAAWEEFADQAEEQQAVTLERMRAQHAKAVAAEAEAARLEAERAEAARVAEAQRVEAERLAAIAADLARQKAELEAEKERLAAASQADTKMHSLQADPAGDGSQKPEGQAEAPAAEAGSDTPEQGSQQVLKAEPATADATDRETPALASPSVGSMGAGQAADAAPAGGFARGGFYRVAAAPVEVPMLKLGELWTQLGFDDREAFLASVGFAATPAPKGTGKLYRQSDVNAIRLAIAKRMTDDAEGLKAA